MILLQQAMAVMLIISALVSISFIVASRFNYALTKVSIITIIITALILAILVAYGVMNNLFEF